MVRLGLTCNSLLTLFKNYSQGY